MNLLRHINLQYLSSEITEKSTRVSHVIDMKGYEGALLMAVHTSGCLSATGCFMSVMGCSSTTLASFTTYKPGSSSVLAPTTLAVGQFARRIFAIDLYKPLKRYARFAVHNTSNGSAVLMAIQYGAKKTSTGFLDHVVAGAANSGTACVAGSTVLVSPTTY